MTPSDHVSSLTASLKVTFLETLKQSGRSDGAYLPTRYLCLHPGHEFPLVPCLLHHQAPHLGQRAKMRPLLSVAVQPEAAHCIVAITQLLLLLLVLDSNKPTAPPFVVPQA